MDLKRQPYILRDQRQKSIAMDRKIKELEEKAQKQSKQVRELMLGGNTLRYSENNQHPFPATGNENELLENKTQTARKRQTAEDYLKYTERMNTLPSAQDLAKKSWEPPPVVNLPPRPQDKQEDKQMQYLKSQEYRKYLQKLLGTGTKEEKVKFMKQNRNHNIYLGNNGGQKRDYIQAMLKSKQVLPRVNHNYGFDRYPYHQRQMVSYSYKKSVSPLPSYHRQNVSQYQYLQTKQLPKETQIFESPIKEAKQFYEEDVGKKQASSNGTLILSPICIKRAFKQEKQAQKIENNLIAKNNKKNQSKKMDEQFLISQKQNKKPIIQKTRKVEKKNNFIDHKISSEKQALKNTQTSAKLLIYKKEIQFTSKKQKSIERFDNKHEKTKKMKSCKYKIIPEQSLSAKSKSQEKYREHQSSFSSNTQSQQDKKKDIYNVSFKLDKPNKIIQKKNYDKNQKQPQYQLKNVTNIKNVLSHRFEPNRYYEKQHQIEDPRYYEKKQRNNPQFYYEQMIPFNFYYVPQEADLQHSQTKSATTIQTDKPHSSKSPRKISVISKPKMK